MSSSADVLKELDDAYDRYRRETDSLQRRKLHLSIQRALIRSQELGDEKIQIAGQMVGRKPLRAALTCSLAGFRLDTKEDTYEHGVNLKGKKRCREEFCRLTSTNASS